MTLGNMRSKRCSVSLTIPPDDLIAHVLYIFANVCIAATTLLPK